MDKQTLVKPFTASGREQLKQGSAATHVEEVQRDHERGKHRVLKEKDAWKKLGYSFSTWRKWQILFIMFLIQISINLNASLYANGVGMISDKFGISKQAARVPQLTFLVAYAFGCELWAPWSEELGRWPTQQLSLLLVNIWQIPCALAPNYATLVVCRFLGGLSTAGGSVTLGVVADMWLPDDQEYAVAFLVMSSVGGSVVGAVVGAFLEAWAPLVWLFWTQMIVGFFVQALHFFFVPETRSTILLDREAKKRRADGEENIFGPNECKEDKMTVKDVLVIWARPFHMLFTEPIVAWLSLLSGFSDSLIFTFLQGFTPVYQKWGFSTYQLGLAFIPLLVGYFLSYLSFLPSIHYFRQKRRRYGSKAVSPEKRLWWLLFVIFLEPIGLFIFAWTGIGPSYGIPWIAPMIGSALVGIANYAIYQSSIDYTVAAYGAYAASATGGNDFCRDFLSGIAALYSEPMYTNIGNKFPQAWAGTILAVFSLFVTTPIFYFYKNGEKIRMNSKFASRIAKEREEEDEDDSEHQSDERQGRDSDATMIEAGDGHRHIHMEGADGAAAAAQAHDHHDHPEERSAYL
ncbi:MFS multidrug transporter [Kockovaella imperatae]|uniref:MFS multidrug transporter n=1 Tax=Kockovaella imperatae TaxID=4999 RepID=A0A1Y1UQI8_9TREE|nr:MFS multidrug transporter [Kockovaella imperatae]ORX40311.1 MFS multidrug transporter [Kockovaella imperatae]